MNMSDNISLLLPKKQDSVILYRSDSNDPYFYRDLRIHLQKNPDYREEKKAYRRAHNISVEQATLDFPKVFVELFLMDIDLFLLNNPENSIEELTEGFSKKWRGYQMTYGEEFIRRAFLERQK